MHTWRKQFGNVCAINLFTRRIEDEEQFTVLASIGKPRDHQIVDDAATIIQELCVALLAWTQAEYIARNQCFQCRANGFVPRISGDKVCLAHVADVEQAGVHRSPCVLFDYAARVLHRHFVACELNHARAEL